MKKSNKIIISIVFIIIFLTFNGIEARADRLNLDKNVYLIVTNRYTLEDIKYMPNLNEIINEASIGLMNTRGLSGYKGAESYITINASNKAASTYKGTQIYNINEENGQVYTRRLGKPSRESELINISLNTIIQGNKKNNYMPFIGALGDNLHNNGYYTASYGNADTDEYLRRPASLIPMDSKGLIDYGNVDDILVNDPDMPYGLRTDYDKMIEEIINIKDKASLIVADTGDLDRLYSYHKNIKDDLFIEKRKEILESIDNFIGELKEQANKEKSLLIVISPNSGDERVDGSKLSPIILWGKGIPKGILTSSTTKQTGIVANLDIGPTVAEFLGISKTNMIGNAINWNEKADNLNYITKLNDRINTTFMSRYKALSSFNIIAIIIILLATTLLVFNIKITNSLNKVMNFLLTLIITAPLVFILSSSFNIDSIFKFVIINISLLLLLTVILYKMEIGKKNFILLGLIYVTLVVDLLTNNFIIKRSILAPDPIIGARYFGIGNELVGVFLSVIAILLGIIIDEKGYKLVSIILLILSVFLVGHSRIGANVGGSISMLTASLYFILELRNKNVNFKRIVSSGLFVVLFVLFMGVVDIKYNSPPTHLGSALMMAKSSKSVPVKIIARKVLMNIKLMGTSIWVKTLLVTIFSNIVMILKRSEEIRKIYKEKKGLSIGVLSSIVGSITGFLFNDSGVLLSALAMIYITIVLLNTLIDSETIS